MILLLSFVTDFMNSCIKDDDIMIINGGWFYISTRYSLIVITQVIYLMLANSNDLVW